MDANKLCSLNIGNSRSIIFDFVLNSHFLSLSTVIYNYTLFSLYDK